MFSNDINRMIKKVAFILFFYAVYFLLFGLLAFKLWMKIK